ncbi:UNVERIFIED_CONTAM: Pathogenesis-related protein STH-2, partial [Sesamum radiatum]
MGIKSFFKELKTTVSLSRLFTALITAYMMSCQNSCPIPSRALRRLEEVTVLVLDALRRQISLMNYVCKYTLIHGDVLLDKLEKISHEIKFGASEDGGCAVKLT